MEGGAKAFRPELPLSGLAGPSKVPSVSWSFDQTASGSNFFRFTKENIYSVVLKSTDGAAVRVQSDGTQHTRAWVEENCIRLLVADYNNAGSENFLVSHAVKGYKPLRKGDKIQGLVRFKL